MRTKCPLTVNVTRIADGRIAAMLLDDAMHTTFYFDPKDAREFADAIIASVSGRIGTPADLGCEVLP